MSKELYMAAHEQLVEEYMEEHSTCSLSEAYEATVDAAHERMCDNLAARADAERTRRKERQ